MRVITPYNAAYNGGSGEDGGAGSFEITINVTGNSSAGFAVFQTTNFGVSGLAAGMYQIALLAEVTNTTIPGGSAILDFFEVQYETGGSPFTTSISSSDLSVNLVYSDLTVPPVIIDVPSDLQWRYSISGWTSGACTLKLRAQLTRLC